MLRKLTLIVVTFWVGGLWMTGLSASILFGVIENRQLAGLAAGQLFKTISVIGLASGVYLLAQAFVEHKMVAFKQYFTWVVLLILVLVLIGHFGIQPYLAQIKLDALPADVMQSDLASKFSFWHGVAGGIYLIECMLGLLLVLVHSPKSN